MRKGQTNNPHGRPAGAKGKAKPERNLIRTFTDGFLASLGQEGYNAWAKEHMSEAMQIATRLAPQQIGLDNDTCGTLAELMQKLAGNDK